MSSISLSEPMKAALVELSERLAHLKGQWVVGGSCGLILHGVELSAQPRDLDIYVDEPVVTHVATSLRDIAIAAPHVSETAMYRSNLSHYNFANVHIELVGGFEVNSDGSLYRVQVDEALAPYNTDYIVNGKHIKLIALAHELVFNLLRKRVDRYEVIAKAMRKDIAYHEHVLQHIVQKNKFSTDHLNALSELLGVSIQDVGGG